MKVLLVDLDHPAGRVLSRFESLFTYRNGIFSVVDRIRRLRPESEFVYLHADARLERIYAARLKCIPFRQEHPEIDLASFTAERPVSPASPITVLEDQIQRRAFVESVLRPLYGEDIEVSFNPISLLDEAPPRITADLFLLNREDFEHRQTSELIGAKQDLWIHQSVELPPGVVFDTKTGPVVIDENCSLTPFTYIAGPFYSAPGCHLDSVRITGGSILGESCRVGGEIENSIFGNYTNKHHEGFVGHSLTGDWVNLGALTTTSDLKNNYGIVRLQLPVSRFPTRASSFFTFDTERIKFGSLIGSCVKTAIGTMLNTGTVIDAGSSVFGGPPPSYVPPLSWGLSGHSYRPGRFLEDSEKIFARRKQSPDPTMQELVALLSHQG